MNPKTINYLNQQANFLKRKKNDNLSAFCSQWIVWEALRSRMFAVAFWLQGFRIADAYAIMGSEKISSQSSFASLWYEYMGHGLSQSKGNAGKCWRVLNEIEQIRHRIIHGYRRVPQDWFEDAGKLLEAILSDPKSAFGKLIIYLNFRKIVSSNFDQLAQRLLFSIITWLFHTINTDREFLF